METKETRSYNVGSSNYSKLPIQPWDIRDDWKLPDTYIGDILSYLIRTKEGDPKMQDIAKIRHTAEDRIAYYANNRDAKRMKSICSHTHTAQSLSDTYGLSTLEQYIMQELYDIAFGHKTYYEGYSNIAMYAGQILDAAQEGV